MRAKYTVITFSALILLAACIYLGHLLWSDPLPDTTPAAKEGIGGADGMTILLDGAESAAPEFHPGGGQPIVAVRVTEPGGDIGLIVIDIGDFSDASQNNLERWHEQQALASPREDAGIKKALYVSHVHSYNALFSPKTSEELHRQATESLSNLWKHFGDVTLQGPNLDFFCARPGETAQSAITRKLCDGLVRSVEPALEPVRYSDGTLSQRAWTLTYPIITAEGRLPFDPYETSFVFSNAGGYIVYSVCSHPLTAEESEGSAYPFHAGAVVRRRIDDGELPPGPIHTLITGACGMEQLIGQIIGGQASIAQVRRAWRDNLEEYLNPMVTERIYVSHCGLLNRSFMMALSEVFHGDVERALPGSFIPF